MWLLYLTAQICDSSAKSGKKIVLTNLKSLQFSRHCSKCMGSLNVPHCPAFLLFSKSYDEKTNSCKINITNLTRYSGIIYFPNL